MNTRTLSEEVSRLEKKDFNISIENKKNNLPQVRKVAIAKRRAKFVMLVALFISCFSLSVFIGFVGPFLLFK